MSERPGMGFPSVIPFFQIHVFLQPGLQKAEDTRAC